eukprot:CAMPEP_0172441866 /NCGR_PEP_ID=MMETSP1065-20121228/2378_1 /TAXON_ID=265537 /ORGANISM="Amphiprora paludosa, Strain CCMP125" /LENGTH=225 /DNA_ID=CAMNT_0013191461 /DNA_START=232 /DNA_END=909 /DNA_ORIENTATION=+
MTVAGAAGKFANTYKDSLVEHPLLTKMATGGLLASAGDAIAQSRTEDPYDKPRALSFMAFDMCYRALQHVAFPIIVHQCHGQFLGPLVTQLPTDYAAAMEQTLASQLGIVPFLYYPIFFAVSGAIQGLTADAAVDRAKENFLPLMKRNLLFWIPVQFVQFGFIDEQLQIPFLSVAGLCWTFILSAAAGSAKGYNNSQDQIAQQEASAEESATPVYTMTASARVSN